MTTAELITAIEDALSHTDDPGVLEFMRLVDAQRVEIIIAKKKDARFRELFNQAIHRWKRLILPDQKRSPAEEQLHQDIRIILQGREGS